MEPITTFAEYLFFVKTTFLQILEMNRKIGNTCMEYNKFANRACKYTFMNKEDIPSYLKFFEDDIVYDNNLVGLKEDYNKDVSIYRQVSIRLKRRSLNIRPYKNTMLCDAQKVAVEQAPSTDISIISGGAGTGKTTVINQILYNFNRTYRGTKNAFVLAPTGKAARRARETITEPCSISTTHYYAGWGHPLNRRDYQRIASADLIIVDEGSMLSAEMFCLLIQITSAPIILIGDINQLPAVEAGNILKDLITLGVPTYYLTKNYRSNDEILVNANAFIDEEHFPGLTVSDNFNIVEINPNNVTETLAKVEADVILTPFRKEDIDGSCTAINNYIHRQRGFHDNLYHVGEPVILLKNNTKVGYANGETGYVTAVTTDEIYVDLGDRVVAIRDENEIDLNYAGTIHKAQGSEYNNVAIFCPESTLMTRNTLYTALTRAKERVTLYILPNVSFEKIYERTAHTRSTFLSTFTGDNIPISVAA